MRIASLMQQERITSHEDRRKIIQRKEAEDAYRKNAQYFQPKKNPVLIELENLLFGQKDHDLYEKHKEEAKEITPQEQATIQEMQQTEKNVRAHRLVSGDIECAISYTRTTDSDSEQYASGNEKIIVAKISSREEDMLNILESVRIAALAPEEPSSQDLRIATSVSEQIQQVQAKLNGTEIEEINTLDEVPQFVREPIEIKVPERFSKKLKLDPFADTIFGRSYEEAYKANTFKKAAATYATHSEMAKNGYRPGNEPTFSLTA